MGVISLARIDDARTTERLVEVMEKDKTGIVRVYAWEALHARLDRLTSRQRDAWARNALALMKKKALAGDLRIGLVGVIGEGGPTTANKKRIKQIFDETNSMNHGDIRTLWALGDLLARWKSEDLIRYVINRMKNLDDAYRAELVLRRITEEMPLAAEAGPLPQKSRGKKNNYDPKLTTFDRIAQWGNGKSLSIDFHRSHYFGLTGTATPSSENTPEKVIFRNVLKSLLEEDYRDRVDAFIRILLEYVEKPIPEKRTPFPPGRRWPKRPWKYKDPQDNR